MTSRRRQHGVQRHDERLPELTCERQDVLAVAAAEDAVLVLEQHDVNVRAPQCPRRANVVAARSLGDGLEDLRPLRVRRLVDHDHRPDTVDIGQLQQLVSDVVGECADPASAGRVRREDRGTHGVRPFRLMFRSSHGRCKLDRLSPSVQARAGGTPERLKECRVSPLESSSGVAAVRRRHAQATGPRRPGRLGKPRGCWRGVMRPDAPPAPSNVLVPRRAQKSRNDRALPAERGGRQSAYGGSAGSTRTG